MRPRDLAPHHEGGYTREICFVREREEIEHQLGVLSECVRDPRRLIEYGKLSVALLLGHLNPPLDVAHRLEVLAQLGSITRPKLT